MKRAFIYSGLITATVLLFLLVASKSTYRSAAGFISRITGLCCTIGRRSLSSTTPSRGSHGLSILILAVAAAWLFLMERPLWRFDRKALLFVILSVALGPGLLANTLLKDHWGRARPTQIEAFGGSSHFTPAPLPAAECPRNCSFVSGHAALGFSLVAFAFLLPAGTARRRVIAAALGFGGLVGLVRVAQGGHFLSDVVWAGLLVFGTTAILHWLIVEKDALAAPLAIRCYRLAGGGAASAWSRLVGLRSGQIRRCRRG